jgi:hypothetical protein
MVKPLEPFERGAVEANLFPLIRDFPRSNPDFPWHRNRDSAITAQYPKSSQALALDVFETIKRAGSRNAIVDALLADLNLVGKGPWQIDPELTVPKELLGEPRPTQVDVTARGPKTLVLFECKFTEAGGGCCSQTRPVSFGPHKGLIPCNEKYQLQQNPTDGSSARCALITKGVKYWDFVAQVLDVDPSLDSDPCPFSGENYQWMRNLVAALALARASGLSPAFVLVYASGSLPMAKKIAKHALDPFTGLAEGKAVPMRVVTYQRLLTVALAAADVGDRLILEELQRWVLGKIAKVEL